MASTPRPEGTKVNKRKESSKNAESRKLRNRLSQRAFRARQAMRIAELEERLEERQDNEIGADAAWMTKLQDQNASLRDQLLDCHKKVMSLQISMQALAETTARALGIDTVEKVGSPGDSGICHQCRKSQMQQHTPDSESLPSFDAVDDDLAFLEQGTQPLSDEPIISDEAAPASLPGHDYSADAALPTVDEVEEVLPRSNNNGFSQDTIVEACQILDWSDFLPLNPAQQQPLSIENQSHFEINRIHSPPDIYAYPSASSSMGPMNYRDLLARSPFIRGKAEGLKRTNSTFSDHIEALEFFCRRNSLKENKMLVPAQKLSSSIQFMIWAFISVSWQHMTAWHTLTKAHVPLKDLMIWRLTKTPESYVQIVPAYRPTMLQMTVQYPSIIDWIPWPSIRDKLILHHAANPRLDDLICDIGRSYVMSTDLSLLVRCPSSVFGYIGVFDLVRAIAPEATRFSEKTTLENERDSFSRPATYPCFYDVGAIQIAIDDVDDEALRNTSLPAPTPNALFTSRPLAVHAFKTLKMDSGAYNFLLDPAFFERHPELYDSEANTMAQGVSLRPDTPNMMQAPRELNTSILGQYQELSKYSLSPETS